MHALYIPTPTTLFARQRNVAPSRTAGRQLAVQRTTSDKFDFSFEFHHKSVRMMNIANSLGELVGFQALAATRIGILRS